MSYEIKPLEWRGNSRMATAEVAHEAYTVYLFEDWQKSEWRWKRHGDAARVCADLEAGKAACEAHWQARLRECLVPVEWRAIETAPKDGTPVLVWVPDCNSARVAYHHFNAWFCRSSEDYISRPATHWMPLPAPPEVKP